MPKLGKGTTVSGYSQGIIGGNTNPFSSQMNKMGASLIKDHSGLFGSGVKAVSQTSKLKTAQPGTFKMPRGRTM
jgi:hypothetical protein